LDYRTVSARHATIRFKNGNFLFTDAGSSNGSYLYLRRPVELSTSHSVQFRLGRTMISMKVVNKWNKRLFRAVTRRTGLVSVINPSSSIYGKSDDYSVGSNEDDVRITDSFGQVTHTLPRRTRENIMASMPRLGAMSQNSSKHLDLLCALAYPNNIATSKLSKATPLLLRHVSTSGDRNDNDNKMDDEDAENQGEHQLEEQRGNQETEVRQCPVANISKSINEGDKCPIGDISRCVNEIDLRQKNEREEEEGKEEEQEKEVNEVEG